MNISIKCLAGLHCGWLTDSESNHPAKHLQLREVCF